MALLDELEASLRTKWDRDVLAVYADHLQSMGEVRGELIVIDLRIEQDGPLPELVARRKELLAAWLRTLPPGKVQHGFLDVDATGADPVGQVRAALASGGAPYIRTIAIVGPPKTVREALAIIAGEERPALARIVVRQWDETEGFTIRSPSALFAAVPNLDTLEADGYRIFGSAVHPFARRVRASGWDAIESIPNPRADWKSLVELDFAFASHIGSKHTEPPKDLRVPPRTPNLELLDLSRNEPGKLDPHTLGGKARVFGHLLAVDHLRELRLPAIQTAAELATLNALLGGMPRLERILVRPCKQRQAIKHPTATIDVL